MNTSITLALDKRSPKLDGTCPIVLRITHHKKVSQLSTGFSVKASDWNEQTRTIKPHYKGTESVTRLNNQLQKKKAEAVDIIAKLDERKVLNTYTVIQIKSIVEQKPQHSSFTKYAEKVIQDQKDANRIGNARAHSSALAAIQKFVNGRDITFMEINHAFLKKLELHHIKKGKSYNGLAAYLRSIRAIYNLAISEGIADKELYPFDKYEITTVKTRKRAISPSAIRSIEDIDLNDSHPLYHARNYFILSFYLRGISFADLAGLKLENIIDGRIIYDRRKTGKPYSVKITDKIQAILNIYLVNKEKHDYIFPIVKRETIEDKYKDIEWARRRFNKKLKKLAELCGIQENLTSYVSRHSFATIAKNIGIATASISDMLGHSDIKTTQIYLDSLQDDMLDDLHDQIIRKV
jgi:site-specific recombinase XerD